MYEYPNLLFYQKIYIIQMIKNEGEVDQAQYISYTDLQQPTYDMINFDQIVNGLNSKQWKMNFNNLTLLRQINKFYPLIFIQDLLPLVYPQIISQIDNLRSNNSKQALTLASQIIANQNIRDLQKNIISPIVSALFSKTVSQKAFLKKQALSAVQFLPKKYNKYLLQQISNQILSLNSQVSQLATRILVDYMSHNKIEDLNIQFFIILNRTINGKRSFLQKKGKQILAKAKQKFGEQKLIQVLDQTLKQGKIVEDQYKSLVNEIKKNKQEKVQGSIKDFIEMKKKAQSV